MKHLHHANWKMVMENNVDGYHALFTHQSVYDASARRRCRTCPSKVDVVVRDIGNGHSEIDYSAGVLANWTRSSSGSAGCPATKLPRYVAALEKANTAKQAPRFDGRRSAAHVDLSQPVPGRDERDVRRTLGPDETIAYTTPALIPGQDEMNVALSVAPKAPWARPDFSSLTTARSARVTRLGLAAAIRNGSAVAAASSPTITDETGIVNSDKSAETPQRGF